MMVPHEPCSARLQCLQKWGAKTQCGEFGVTALPGMWVLKSHWTLVSTSRLLEATGMVLLQLPNMRTRRDGCQPLAESLGKRKGKEDQQWVNGREVTLWSSVSLISGYLSSSPRAHPIPSHASPAVIPLLPVVNYFQSKCETIKQTEGQSLLTRSKA